MTPRLEVSERVKCRNGASYTQPGEVWPEGSGDGLVYPLSVDLRAWLRQASPGDTFTLAIKATA